MDASLYFDDLCTTLKPRHFGGNGKLLDLMAAQGIDPCEVDVHGNMKSFDYKLEVLFYPLDWFQLLNKFEFDSPVYVGFYTLVGLASIILGGLMWAANRLLTKLRHPPSFHGMSLAKIVAGPACLGCLIAAIPFLLSLAVAYFWFSSYEDNGIFSGSRPSERPSYFAFENIHGNWLDTATLDDEQIERYRKGRMGTAMFAVGLYATVIAASLVVPETSSERGNPSADENKSEDNDYDGLGNAPTTSSVWTPSVWKRAHLIWTSVCLEFVLLVVLEFSYSDIYTENIYRFIVLFKLLQMVLELIIEDSLKENPMHAPLTVVIEVTKIVSTIGA